MSIPQSSPFAWILVASLPIVSVVACSDDDTDDGGGAGRGGTSTSGSGAGGGKPSAGASKGGSASGAPASAGQGGEGGSSAGSGAGGDGGVGASAGTPDGEAGAAGAGGAGDGETVDVSVQFAAQVNGQAFACDKTYESLGPAKFSAKPLDFRFYVHDLKLTGPGGESAPVTLKPDSLWQSDRVALLDFEDKTGSCTSGNAATNTVVQGKVTAGVYTGISFIVGVPFQLNHADQATALPPLDDSGLWWSWASGYRFMRLDFQPQPLGSIADPPTFFFHLGSTDCVGANPAAGSVTSCGRPNRVSVALDGFDAATNKVVIDYGKLVALSHLGINAAGAPGCMSGTADPECVGPYQRLGLDLLTGTPSGSQAVFAVE